MDSWSTVTYEGDHALLKSKWIDMFLKLQSASFEARLAALWKDRSAGDNGAHIDHIWALVRMSPILSEDALIRNITATFTDISLQKWTIAPQIRLTEDAIGAKRQQDNFMDMTSHEMRNPPNAMVLYARELCQMFEVTISNTTEIALKEILTSSLDAANIIVYCKLLMISHGLKLKICLIALCCSPIKDCALIPKTCR